jgi:VanZ family protein
MPLKEIPRFNIPHIDKAAHFIFFFIQSVLLSLLLRFQTKKSYLLIILLCTLLALVYGGAIEILQSTVFNRTGDHNDLIADVLGGFCGALFIPPVRKSRSTKKRS